MIRIDTERVLASLRRLSQFGAVGKGVCRPAMSTDDLAAREWLAEEMRGAGLMAELDEVGNVYGRFPGVTRAFLIGSHSDSVPSGGWLDGALGVIYGIEVARAWRTHWPNAPIGIDVVSFSDEEGRYISCLGSRAFCEDLDFDKLSALEFEGQRFMDVVKAAGLSGKGLARLDLDRHAAYFEAHIEQGPRLHNANVDIGAVTGIVGMQRYVVTFKGRADHAGTTPMAVRHDAGMAAFEFAIECAARFRSIAAPDSVWNFGAVQLAPGVANVVPKTAELTVELRDLSAEVIARMGQALRDLVRECNGKRGVTAEINLQGELNPVTMDPALRAAISHSASKLDASCTEMPSGAIHDAMVLAGHIPAAMMFVPSIDGRSHTPVEDTEVRHIALGAEVFTESIARVAALTC